MGLTGTVFAVGAPPVADGGEVTSLLSSVGSTTASLSVAVALVSLLAYLNLLRARPDPDPRVRRAVIVAVIPLAVTFAGIVLYESLLIVDLL